MARLHNTQHLSARAPLRRALAGNDARPNRFLETLCLRRKSPLPLWPAFAYVRSVLELGFEVCHCFDILHLAPCVKQICHPIAVLASKKICQVRALQLLVFNVGKE